jgi:hypothetical protein
MDNAVKNYHTDNADEVLNNLMSGLRSQLKHLPISTSAPQITDAAIPTVVTASADYKDTCVRPQL